MFYQRALASHKKINLECKFIVTNTILYDRHALSFMRFWYLRRVF